MNSLKIPKKGVPIHYNLKKDGQCNRQRKKAKKVVGVWCLTPLSTIFQLYFGGHTINDDKLMHYITVSSHTECVQLMRFSKSTVEE